MLCQLIIVHYIVWTRFNSLSSGSIHTLEALDGIRSKVECATYCHANDTCDAAVYLHSGQCLLVSGNIDKLEVEFDASTSESRTDYLIEGIYPPMVI